MTKQLTTPPKPTKEETQKLDRFFYLPNWQSEALIGNKCTEISKTIIDWSKKDNYSAATIYGLMAIKTETKKDCIANFFVHYENKVFQCTYIEQATKIVELIKKKFKFDEYQTKLWEQKRSAKQKSPKNKKKA